MAFCAFQDSLSLQAFGDPQHPMASQMKLAHLMGSCTGPLPALELQSQRRYTSMYALLEDSRSGGAAAEAAASSAVGGTGSS